MQKYQFSIKEAYFCSEWLDFIPEALKQKKKYW